MFVLLGSIQIGVDVLTGPTSVHEGEKSTFARISVAQGKPALQDRGDELDTRKMKFFFDETFCDPEEQMARLRSARASREPLALVGGDGSYTGSRYVVEAIDVDVRKTTKAGRVVRIEMSLTLVEAPIEDLGALQAVLALAQAPGLATAASALNVLAKVIR